MKQSIVCYALLAILFWGIAAVARCEGTAQVMPNINEGTALLIQPSTSSGPLMGAAVDNRLKIRITDHQFENLYFGLNPMSRSTPSSGAATNCYYRIINPAGNVAVPATQLYTLAGSEGVISNYAEAVRGPNINGLNPDGYSPIFFDPDQDGDYSIELFRSNTAGASMLSGNAGEAYFMYFDFTVGKDDASWLNGRVHCQKWSFICYSTISPFLPSINTSFEGDFFAYTADSSVVRVDFQSGFRPLGYVLTMNQYGVSNTGNVLADRISVYSGTTTPAFALGYPIFLSEPDENAFLRSIRAPAPTLPLQIYGCTGGYAIPFHLSQPGDVALLLDLNGSSGYQGGTADVLLERYGLAAGNHAVFWNGLNGLGGAVVGGETLPLSATLLRGRTNIPIYDAELNQNGFSASGVWPATGNQRLYWADNALAPVGICPSGATGAQQGVNNITGAGVAATQMLAGIPGPAHAWDGNGANFALPAPSVSMGANTPETCDDFGNARTINTWFWAAQASASATFVLPDCDRDNDGIADTPPDLDDDNDGITDPNESNGSDPGGDADSDGIPNFIDPQHSLFADHDHDCVSDAFDADLDGIINAWDTDSDNDGISDLVENINGSTTLDLGAGVLLDGVVGQSGITDANADGLHDGLGAATDSDGDGIPNNLDWDADEDGIADTAEGVCTGCPAPLWVVPYNHEGNDLPDFLDTDSDNDGLPDWQEGFDATCDGNYVNDLVALAASYESANGNPGHFSTTDTDGDLIPDWADNLVGAGVNASSRMPCITVGNAARRDANANGLADLFDPQMHGTAAPTPNCDGLADDDFRDVNPAVSLPIQFVLAEAWEGEAGVSLFWEVSEGIMGGSFLIERMDKQTKTFATLATQDSRGQMLAYQFEDQQPLPGLNVYRVVALGPDGETMYSPVMQAWVGTGSRLQLSPNPAASVVWVGYWLAEGEMLTRLEITDLKGALLEQQPIMLAAQGDFPVVVSRLAAGGYWLTLSSDQSRYCLLLLKQ